MFNILRKNKIKDFEYCSDCEDYFKNDRDKFSIRNYGKCLWCLDQEKGKKNVARLGNVKEEFTQEDKENIMETFNGIYQ